MRKLIFLSVFILFLSWGSPIFSQMATSPLEPFAFIYEEVDIDEYDGDDGDKVVVRMAYPYSQKIAKDEENINKKMEDLKGKMSAQNVDLRSLASWMYFKDQLELWEKYIQNNVFRRELKTSIKKIKWQNKDDVQSTLNSIFQDFQTQAQDLSEEQRKEIVRIDENRESRADRRVDYAEFLDSSRFELETYADGWIARNRGEVISMDGYHYLISDKPIKQIPREHYNVVAPTGFLTPYDFLNSDGTHKKPRE